MKYGWGKVPNWECLFVHREKGLFLSVYVDDIKLAGKKQNIDPMWKLFNQEVDLGEPTSFLDHVKDNVKYAKILLTVTEPCSNPEFPQEELKNYHARKIFAYDMEGHAKKCVERYCELANKTTQQLYKVSTPCIDDHHFKDIEDGAVDIPVLNETALSAVA